VSAEALVQTVREGRDPGHPTVFDDALDALAAELERLRTEEHAWKCLDEERVAELERLQNKLNTDSQNFELEARKEQLRIAEARLDKALAALREIDALSESRLDEVPRIVRLVIAEIEGEA
jgi:hypothetical protein